MKIQTIDLLPLTIFETKEADTDDDLDQRKTVTNDDLPSEFFKDKEHTLDIAALQILEDTFKKLTIIQLITLLVLQQRLHGMLIVPD